MADNTAKLMSLNAITVPSVKNTAGVIVDPTKVLSGTSISGVTGSMPNNGSPTFNPSTSTQTLSAGYYSGGTINPVTGTATASQVLSGQTFSSALGINQTGTMPNNGSPTLQPGQSITPGYYSGGSVINETHGTQIYSTPGSYTFTVPSGVNQIIVACCGGGGGGGDGNNSYNGGSGGGAGGTAFSVLSVTPGQQFSITVGSGGAPDSNGSNSTFGSLIGYGGSKGTVGTNSGTGIVNGGLGGSASGGTYNATGEQGQYGAYRVMGRGGNSFFGTGGYGGDSTEPGGNGGLGAGGGGGYNQAGVSGGAGGNGCVQIWW